MFLKVLKFLKILSTALILSKCIPTVLLNLHLLLKQDFLPVTQRNRIKIDGLLSLTSVDLSIVTSFLYVMDMVNTVMMLVLT